MVLVAFRDGQINMCSYVLTKLTANMKNGATYGYKHQQAANHCCL